MTDARRCAKLRRVSARAAVTVNCKSLDGRVVVDVENGTKAPITVVTHPRYLFVELLDARGQFVGGAAGDQGVPSKKDFVDIEPKATSQVASLEVAREGDSVVVGAWKFEGAPSKTEVRITYKPDAIVMNLPSNKRRTFFRGPVTSGRVPVEIRGPDES